MADFIDEIDKIDKAIVQNFRMFLLDEIHKKLKGRTCKTLIDSYPKMNDNLSGCYIKIEPLTILTNLSHYTNTELVDFLDNIDKMDFYCCYCAEKVFPELKEKMESQSHGHIDVECTPCPPDTRRAVSGMVFVDFNFPRRHGRIFSFGNYYRDVMNNIDLNEARGITPRYTQEDVDTGVNANELRDGFIREYVRVTYDGNDTEASDDCIKVGHTLERDQQGEDK
nr:MAG: hypothetical protein [Lokiarchaeota virus Ratatoskr Meg22_1012]